jgi:hypothetical protein
LLAAPGALVPCAGNASHDMVLQNERSSSGQNSTCPRGSDWPSLGAIRPVAQSVQSAELRERSDPPEGAAQGERLRWYPGALKVVCSFA